MKELRQAQFKSIIKQIKLGITIYFIIHNFRIHNFQLVYVIKPDKISAFFQWHGSCQITTHCIK